MLSYAANKNIIISEDEETDSESDVVTGSRWVIDTENLYKKNADCLTIALPDYATEDIVDVSVRNDQLTLSVTIKNTKENYFLSNPPTGDYSVISKAQGIYDGANTTVSFELTTPVKVEEELIDSELRLTIRPVSEIENTIVVIDPGHGGSRSGVCVNDLTEKEQVLKIAKYVEEYSEGKPYTVILTRTSDVTMGTEDRINAVKASKASYYIGIHFDSDTDDTGKFGMWASYNPTYYQNGLENVDFADCLLKNTVTEASDRALGLFEATDNEIILKALDIPATVLYTGYVSNTDEEKLLESDGYLKTIAKGIVNAIDEVTGSK